VDLFLAAGGVCALRHSGPVLFATGGWCACDTVDLFLATYGVRAWDTVDLFFGCRWSPHEELSL
jgi:hypothetical protein